MAKSDEQVMEEFDEAVNMSSKELEKWLETEESKEVGQKDGGSESPSTTMRRAPAGGAHLSHSQSVIDSVRTEPVTVHNLPFV